MKLLSALAAGLFATTVSSLALPAPEAGPEAVPEALPEAAPEADPEAAPAAFAGLSDVQIIKWTVYDWQADTQVVSSFLDNVAKKVYRSDIEFTRAAKIAWLAEYSSSAPTWGNKAVLDCYLNGWNGSNGSNGSNGTERGNGTWTGENSYGEQVKGYLAQLKTKKWRWDQPSIQKIVADINQIRCKYVLPAIDGYFRTASDLVASYTPSKPDSSLSNVRAVRAQVCSVIKREVDDLMVEDWEE